MNHRTVARIALGYLALFSAQIGFWALFAPRSFYDDFPGLGRMWIAIDGPFNEHFIRDVGALNLALLVLLVATFVLLSRQLLVVSAGAVLAWGVPHAIYHLANTEGIATSDAVLSIGGLIFFALLGFVLLAAASRTEPEATAIG